MFEMPPERLQQVEELYHAARERQPGERSAFLAAACSGDEELRREVESLLAHQHGRELMTQPALQVAASLLGDATETNWAIGTELGPYRIERLLGTGDMGQVFQARDTRLGRAVAIKIIHDQFSERFEREARAISGLNHPNICTLYDVGANYLVMELVEGETLAARLKKGALSTDLVLRYGAQIAEALAIAHAKGIIHRDLKPGNIIVAQSGIKVLDFGLAKVEGEALTRSNAVMGTPAYMAPEQQEGKVCDARSDIYALGLVLCEMATGKRAQPGKRPQFDSLPQKLAHVVERCIEENPEARWRSAMDVKLELEWCAAPSADSAESAKQIPPAQVNARPTRMAWVVAAFVIGAAVALTFIHFSQAAPETRVVRSTVLPPEKTSFSFTANFDPVALSPDGRRMVFAATTEDGKSQLWIRPLDAAAAQPLPSTEGGQSPFWSPDSRWVAFFADGKLKKINTAGGPPVIVADAPRSYGGSWSANGAIVFAPEEGIYGLRRISSGGGDTTPATTVGGAAGGRHHSPWFLPDGEHFLFAAYGPKPGLRMNLMVGALGSTASKLIGETDYSAAYTEGRLLYILDGTLMAQPFDVKSLRAAGEAVPVAERVGFFSASGAGLLEYQTGADRNGRQITWFDRTGKAMGTVGEPRRFLVDIEFSPDRKRLATSSSGITGNSDLWTYDMPQGAPTRFTFDPATEFEPVWSPDGQTIAFLSTRMGRPDLYRKPANGSGAEELLYANGLQKFPTSWSPDGKFLLYYAEGGPQGADLFLLPLTPERPGAPLMPVPFLQTRFNERFGRFSPDGRWVAYTSDESQVPEIYVAPFRRPAEKHQISVNGGTRPRWRQDGKEIFYVTPSGRLMAAEVRISSGTVEVGAVHALFDGIPLTNTYLYDVSTDGQRILAAVPAVSQKGAEPITLVQNWAVALKK